MKKWIVFLLFLCAAAGAVLGCGEETDEIEIFTDIEFVQDKFPGIDDIKSVKYYYYYKNGEPSRYEIGMYPKVFGGLIEVGDGYAAKIEEGCEWEACDEELSDPKLFDGNSYDFQMSDDFGCDSEYVTETSSFVGEFYYDADKRVVYFTGEY